MKVVFHYAAGPDLRARLAALPGLEVTVCPDAAEPAFAATVVATRDLDFSAIPDLPGSGLWTIRF